MIRVMISEYEATVSGQTFEIKEDLKQLGYRWDGKDKLWYKSVRDQRAEESKLREVFRKAMVKFQFD